MPTSLIDAESVLAVDIGAMHTRAILFDVVDGQYRFVAAGKAFSTAAAPWREVSEGVRDAIVHLEAITGRTLLTSDHRLIMPAQDGTGVGSFVATISAGPILRTVVAALLEDVSLASVQRLARTTYARVVETISLNDRRKPEEQVDTLLRLQPDLILIAGGTDGGASRSLQSLLEIIGLGCYLLPAEKRPAILFAGNQDMARVAEKYLQTLSLSMYVAPNLRPVVDEEDLLPAQHALAALYVRLRAGQLAGMDELAAWAGEQLWPTAYAAGRIIRFLSQGYSKGILHVDIGASATALAAGFSGDLKTGVYPQFGLGEGMASLLRYTTLEDVLRWLPLELSAEMVQDYLYHKSLYPTTIPVTVEELAIEQAVARQALQLAFASLSADFPRQALRPAPGYPPYFDPVLASGSVLTAAPTLGQALLILLDGLQPLGMTTIVLDQQNLLAALGATAGRVPILPVQVLDSGAFAVLATVVAPVVTARPGTPVLRARLITQSGRETTLEVKQGTLETMPLPPGDSGRLLLQPLHHADVGFGPGRGGEVPVSGTVFGIVFDARGRPLFLPTDGGRRREMIKKWLWTLGG